MVLRRCACTGLDSLEALQACLPPHSDKQIEKVLLAAFASAEQEERESVKADEHVCMHIRNMPCPRIIQVSTRFTTHCLRGQQLGWLLNPQNKY